MRWALSLVAFAALSSACSDSSTADVRRAVEAGAPPPSALDASSDSATSPSDRGDSGAMAPDSATPVPTATLPADYPMPVVVDEAPCTSTERVVAMAEVHGTISALTASDTHVYFAEHGKTVYSIRGANPGTPGPIFSIPVCGGPIQVVTAQTSRYDVLFDAGEFLYFVGATDYVGLNRTLGRIRKDTSDVEPLDSGDVSFDARFTADDTHFYWSNQSALFRVAHDATDVEQIASVGQLTALTVDADALWWAEGPSVYTSSKDGSSQSLAYSAGYAIGGMASHLDSLLLGTSLGGSFVDAGVLAGVWRVDGNGVETLIAPIANVDELAVRDAYVFWADERPALMRVRWDGTDTPGRIAPEGSPRAVAGGRAYTAKDSLLLGWQNDPIPEPTQLPPLSATWRIDSGASFDRIAVDGSGSVIVAGAAQGSVDMGGTTFTFAGSDTAFVAKYDATGTYLWTKTLQPSERSVRDACLATDTTDEILAGDGRSGTGILARLAGDGSTLWTRPLDFPAATCASVSPDAMYYAGTPGSLPTLVKLGTGGVEQWRQALPSGTAASALQADDGGATTAVATPDGSVVTRYDVSGNPSWSVNVAQGEVVSIALAPDGGLLLLGDATRSILIGDRPATAPAPGYYSEFLARLAADSTVEWVRFFRGTATAKGATQNQQLAIADDGTITFAGSSDQGITDLGLPDDVGRYPAQPFFVARLGADGTRLTTWAPNLSALAVDGTTVYGVNGGFFVAKTF